MYILYNIDGLIYMVIYTMNVCVSIYIYVCVRKISREEKDFVSVQ